MSSLRDFTMHETVPPLRCLTEQKSRTNLELRSNMKWLLRIFFVLVACGFAAGGWFFWAEVREPSFKQRSLSDWLVSYQQANRYFPRSHESDEAIRHIGT